MWVGQSSLTDGPAPQSFPAPNPNVPVIISHWDFDHVSGFFRFPQLQRACWITPVQRLGPGAKKIAAALASRRLLLGWSGRRISWSWGELLKCGGLPTVVNHSGLALIVTLRSGKRGLLVGDANYDTINLPSSSFDYLAVTHHGALFTGILPKPAGPNSLGVISVGRGNVYGHPKEASIAAHKGAHWLIEQTAGTRRLRRGDRILGP